MGMQTLLPAGALVFFLGTGIASADIRVDAFRDACLPDRQDYDAIVAAAPGRGWTPATGDEHPEFRATLDKSAEMLAGEKEMTIKSTNFARTIDGRQLFLVASYVGSEHIDMVGCYIYDFDADAMISPEPITALMGEPPIESAEQQGTVVYHKWDTPQALPGTWDAQVTYLPDGGAGSNFTGFSGLLIQLSAVDPKNE